MQGQLQGFGHDQFSLLVAMYGIGDLWGRLEQHIGYPKLGGTCGSGKACWPCADDSDRERFTHYLATHLPWWL
jgi:hypothetical protein